MYMIFSDSLISSQSDLYAHYQLLLNANILLIRLMISMRCCSIATMPFSLDRNHLHHSSYAC